MTSRSMHVTQGGREDEGVTGTLNIAKSGKAVAQVLDERRSMVSSVKRYRSAIQFGWHFE